MTLDSTGELYVATKLGIQVCDQAGRVVGIISKPPNGRISNLVFGGPDLQFYTQPQATKSTSGKSGARASSPGSR
jgi:Gluconolactonase